MGNENSNEPAPKADARFAEISNRLFEEYKEICEANPQIAKDDFEKWQNLGDSKLDMTAEQLSEYCDYIHRKLGEMDDPEINAMWGDYIIAYLEWSILYGRKVPDTCVLGNIAKCVVCQKDEVKQQRLIELYDQYIEKLRSQKSPNNDLHERIGDAVKGITEILNQNLIDVDDDEQPKRPEDVVVNLFQNLGLDDIQLQKVRNSAEVNAFIRDRLLEGVSLLEAVDQARTRFHLPPGYQISLSFTVEIKDVDDEHHDETQDE